MIKKLSTFFLCLVAMVMSANAQMVTPSGSQIMYIYGLDGDVYRFPVTDIDSIAFVNPTITNMEFSETEFTVYIDDVFPIQAHLSLVPYYAYPAGVEWFSTNPAIADIIVENNRICVKGIVEGSTTIVAKYGNLVATTTIKVLPPQPPVEDGLYIVGEATIITDLYQENAYKNAMSAGHNENASNALREGMYEKYMLLEGGKPFQLVLKQGAEQVIYGATLQAYDLTDGNGYGKHDQPAITIQRGTLTENATLQVSTSGLYHVIADFNVADDLDTATIIVAPVEWGVRGGMNSWGWTAGTATEFNKTTITYTWEDQRFSSMGGEFKFSYGFGWKLFLTNVEDYYYNPDGVSVNTNLGENCVPGVGGNIRVETGGYYRITLTYTLNGGAIEDSYTMNIELTEASTTPTEMYMIGADFGNWNWDDAGIVSLVPVHSHEGQFWTIKYFTADNGFKFCAEKAWNGDFTGLGTDNGYEQKDGNCFVPADGLYIVVVDLLGKAVTIEPAVVYGIGDCFGGWDEGIAEFTVSEDGKTLSIAVPADGNLRMYAHSSVFEAGNWWQHEFKIYDGKIVYRAAGGDQEAVAVTAGQTITLDFATETGSIQ